MYFASKFVYLGNAVSNNLKEVPPTNAKQLPEQQPRRDNPVRQLPPLPSQYANAEQVLPSVDHSDNARVDAAQVNVLAIHFDALKEMQVQTGEPIRCSNVACKAILSHISVLHKLPNTPHKVC